MYVCGFNILWVSGVIIYNYEYLFLVGVSYFWNVIIEQFVIIIYNDVFEIVCGDFVV